jgi:NitT/TauT family transport system substrate-binding protein
VREVWAGRLSLLIALGVLLWGACAPTPAGPTGAPISNEPATAPLVVSQEPATAPVAARPGAPPDPVRIGFLGPIVSNAGIFFAVERGYFEEQGIAAELVPFDGGPRMVPSLATNELQVGAGSPGAGLFNALQRGVRSKVVADKASGPPGIMAAGLLVRKDLFDTGQLTRLEDLRGKTFGLVSFDSSLEHTLAYHLALVGMAPSDLNLVELPSADQPAAFGNRSIDAALSLEPLATLMTERELAVRLLDTAERHPNQQPSVIMYSEQFAEQRDPATRWVMAYLKGVRDYNDAFIAGINREDGVRVLEKVGVITDRAQFDRFGRIGLNPNGYVNRLYLQDLHDYFVRKGSIPNPVALDDLVDDTFVTGALARLGIYDSPLYRDAVWLR